MNNIHNLRKFINYIGISGGSCSGKTTVSKEIQKELQRNESISVYVLNSDEFYRIKGDCNHQYDESLNCEIYDIPSSINWKTLKEKMLEVSQDYDLIIVEGIMIFQEPELFNLTKEKYFLSISYDTMKRRRFSRIYDDLDSPEYFEKYVWKNYLVDENIALQNKIQLIDSDNLSIEQIVENLLGEINTEHQ